MSLHTGSSYVLENVRIGQPVLEEVLGFPAADDVQHETVSAIKWAQEDRSVYYFSVFYGDALVGQIYLHDIGCEPETALIGYHLFHPKYRGRGVGTKALHLLQDFAIREMSLKRLVIITGRENSSSRRIAEKNGFTYLGGAYEDPENLVVFEWKGA